MSRFVRRARRFAPWRRTPAHFVYNPRYALELPHGVIDPQRGQRILSFLDATGHLRRGSLHRARRIPLAALARVHEATYLQSLQEPRALLSILGYELPDPLQDTFLATQRAMVGGTLLAAQIALRRRTVAVNLGGGLHHALAGRGQGMCAFNDVAVAVAELRATGFAAPVVVIDLDLHDGDGTRSLFAADPSVHTFSIHNLDLGSPEAVASTSVALGSGVEDAAYLSALAAHLPPVLAATHPGLVFYLAGCDPAHDDRIGDWRISVDGMLRRDRYVMDCVQAGGPHVPTVILLAGGYGPHAWRYSARFLGSLLNEGRVREPPPTSEFTLAGYRRVAKLLRLPELTVEADKADWALTEADLDPSGASTSSRVLGFYSKHGVELALERFGLLRRLRGRGFPNLTVDFELNDRVGHTVRIQSVGETLQTLIEFRVRRDRRSLTGMELLAVEWLLSQDPRMPFMPERPPLAGQEHPSLGLMRDFAALFRLVCEQLGLDGVIFTPSHYHVAAQVDVRCGFLDPAREAWFRAVQKALTGLRVSEASRALGEGRVVDRRTGAPATWTPSPMVVPRRRRLREWLDSETYRESVAAALADLDFELRKG